MRLNDVERELIVRALGYYAREPKVKRCKSRQVMAMARDLRQKVMSEFPPGDVSAGRSSPAAHDGQSLPETSAN